jgi:cytoplasmic tRNA 2-thiolation protein 1
MPQCAYCASCSAVLKRPKTGEAVCKLCFLSRFEQEIHDTITSQHLFSAGERVAIAASGGKDSTVLAAVLTKLNRQYSYGLDLFLLSVDEGISGYRDDSLRSLQRQREELGLELAIVSYADLYGWTMDQIVQEIGKKNNCTSAQQQHHSGHTQPTDTAQRV